MPIELLLLPGVVLSLLQFSLGRIIIRLYCLFALLDIATFVYRASTASAVQVVEVLFWVYVQSCFAKRSWSSGLYHPLGLFGKR